MPTTQIPRDFSEFLKSLIAHDVKFLLIGGYAVAAFGFVRTTRDIDVWIGGDADNQNRVVRAVSLWICQHPRQHPGRTERNVADGRYAVAD